MLSSDNFLKKNKEGFEDSRKDVEDCDVNKEVKVIFCLNIFLLRRNERIRGKIFVMEYNLRFGINRSIYLYIVKMMLLK